MSAAEPARPGPDHPRAGTVLPFTASRPPRHRKRRENRVPEPRADLTAHDKLAASVEDLFAKHGRSLTDAETAEDYLITLRFVRIMLKGALNRGKLTEEQYQVRDGMVEGMMTAPGLLA